MEFLIINPKTGLSKTLKTWKFTQKEFLKIIEFYNSISWDVMVRGEDDSMVIFKDKIVNLYS